MTATYLGMRRRTAAALAIAALAAGVALGLAVEPAHPCGTVAEDGEAVPAYCGDPAELVDALDRIRDGRTGGRFAPVRAERDRTADAARCAAINGAPLTGSGCASYLAEVDAVAAACGHLADGSAWGACADRVLAAHRAEVAR